MCLKDVPVLKIFWCLGETIDQLGTVPADFDWRKDSIRPFLWDCSYKEGCRCVAWHGPRFSSYIVINAELRILKETQWILFQYTYIKKKIQYKEWLQKKLRFLYFYRPLYQCKKCFAVSDYWFTLLSFLIPAVPAGDYTWGKHEYLIKRVITQIGIALTTKSDSLCTMVGRIILGQLSSHLLCR